MVGLVLVGVTNYVHENIRILIFSGFGTYRAKSPPCPGRGKGFMDGVSSGPVKKPCVERFA